VAKKCHLLFESFIVYQEFRLNHGSEMSIFMSVLTTFKVSKDYLGGSVLTGANPIKEI